ncbi:MalY/PatB family protein [Octadecabacter sp. 1_MG-2023]|uniref:MalY/PatB family protein n=1 Tax=unclassified Octadecabacter TaxID=196158 RepID=UPI001C0A1A1C|nr:MULTISPECIES: MalY/PatB family protein [unclassified Octadecabacter]MBU2992592.1 pyridoxal phosphate-dependent aminotransferase [Octadecabacter sp. B2R22]MDO6734651.1 MalY/PatB family protein [Octadecabacter sp. 1_MG-2023]
MDFDTPINRRGTHCIKWDGMEPIYGVDANDGIAMWVADMEFKPPQCVQDAIQAMHDHGVYGYFGDETEYLAAIQWWMKTRHNWHIDPSWIFTTHGLVNGTGMCVDAFTAPGDGVVLFTPVYHAFAKVINAAGRQVVECPLVNHSGRYEFDFDAYDAQMTGNERMVILCSPHNPGGRVWTKGELQAVASFAKRHDLLLVSDEIHHDLTFGAKHTPMAHIEGIEDRLVTMTATTKTFNIAGSHSGNVIIEDPDLRAQFAGRMAALGLSPNSFGLFMATAAYSPEGAAWVDELRVYLDGNRKLFDDAVNAIPGLASMPLESTYLAWVDFSGTGMTREDFTRRVEQDAKIAANHGPTFGCGGDNFLRFNFAAPRAQVQEAVDRLAKAFGDLQ